MDGAREVLTVGATEGVAISCDSKEEGVGVVSRSMGSTFSEPNREFVIVVNNEVISCICAVEKPDAVVSRVAGLGVGEGVAATVGLAMGR